MQEEEKHYATTKEGEKVECSFGHEDIREKKKRVNLMKFNASLAKDGKDSSRRQSE